MSTTTTEENRVKGSEISYNRLRDLLAAKLEIVGTDATFDINREGEGSRLLLSFFEVEDQLILSAQTAHGYFEIHNIAGYVVVEPDEVIFFGGEPNSVSGLIVGRQGSCSLFANVERQLLEAEPSKLAPPQMLAAMQLGLISLRPVSG